MRMMQRWGFLAAALGVLMGSASPASVWAHALAHHRDVHDTHLHVTSLDAHDGPAELSAGEHPRGHGHARLDLAKPTSATTQLAFAWPAITVAAELALPPSRQIPELRHSFFPLFNPSGGDPPKLRAPPIR